MGKMKETELINSSLEVLCSTDTLWERYRSTISNFEQRKEQWSNNKIRVGLIGVTSSGKSSIINGLMQKNTLFVSSTPSTVSITEVEFKDDIIENQLYAINKDATIERIDEDVFNQLIKKSDEDFQRLKLVTKST